METITQQTELRKYNKKQFQIADRIKTISWKFRDVSESYPEISSVQNVKVNCSSSFYNAFKFLFDHEVKEKFIVFWLSSANFVIGYEIICEGTLSSCTVQPREVFRGAIVNSCANIIVAHNHPSGNLEPSNEDITITKQLIAAGKIIEIKVFDHIIFTNNNFYSFVDKRII